MKVVVFDLDETLGYFTQFGIFWDSLKEYLRMTGKNKLSQSDFNIVLDMYPEFLRPNIMNILNYLKKKKQSNCCHKMMIYTNNTGPKEWANHIVGYFENKIGVKLIDQIIAAFKINGKKVEICRTTHNKTHKDLVRCTKIPADSDICFIDDYIHPGMTNDNIYYINIKPYYHDLQFNVMLERFKTSELGNIIISNDVNFDKIMEDNMKLYRYLVVDKNPKEYEVDKVLGKYIITHLQMFFSKSSRNKTIKNKILRRNKTFKNRSPES